ncbi:hypothetical protein Btru_040070 [Bulinus truncatus]|nr:hypothetical protein Btru_040070 [Bulinus truncatus]
MGDEHEVTLKEEQVSMGSQNPSATESMRRCRSLNELPGYHRVTVLKRKDTERTRARLEAVAAGMEELRSLRERHQLLMEETLCESAKKQPAHRSGDENMPHRSPQRHGNQNGLQQLHGECMQEASHRTGGREENLSQSMREGNLSQHMVSSEKISSHSVGNTSQAADYLQRNMSQSMRNGNVSQHTVNSERTSSHNVGNTSQTADYLQRNMSQSMREGNAYQHMVNSESTSSHSVGNTSQNADYFHLRSDTSPSGIKNVSHNNENFRGSVSRQAAGHGRNSSQSTGNHEVNVSQSRGNRHDSASHHADMRKDNMSHFHVKQSENVSRSKNVSRSEIVSRSDNVSRNQASLGQKEMMLHSFQFQNNSKQRQPCVTEQSKMSQGISKPQHDQRRAANTSQINERNQSSTHINRQNHSDSRPQKDQGLNASVIPEDPRWRQNHLDSMPHNDQGPAAYLIPEDLRQRDRKLQNDRRRLNERFQKDQKDAHSVVQEDKRRGSAKPREDPNLCQTGTPDKYASSPSVQIHSQNGYNKSRQEEIRRSTHSVRSSYFTPSTRDLHMTASELDLQHKQYSPNRTIPGDVAVNAAQLRESQSVTSLHSTQDTSFLRHAASVYSVTENHLKLENGRDQHLESRDTRYLPTEDDYEQRRCRVLTQSDQRFSRGRTQSVHENFYYFPQRSDSGRNNLRNAVKRHNDPAARHSTYAKKNSSSRSHNNCQADDISKLTESQPNETRPISSLQPPPQNKSISWEELLVTVGIGKTDSQQETVNTRLPNNEGNELFQNMADVPSRRETQPGRVSALDDKLRKNSDQHYHLYQGGVSQKPSRSQSFSSPSGNVYDSLIRHGGNISRNSVELKPQRTMSSADVKSALYSGVSRHHSLYILNSRQPIFNPLHEVDISSLDRPGPVHAVTLQYVGLSTRHLSMGSISSASSLSSVIEGVNLSSDPSPSNDPYPSISRTRPSTSQACKPPTEISRASLPSAERRSADTVNCSATKTSSRMPLIKTIDEDSEDVFEYSFEWSQAPSVKPRSYSDVPGRSGDFNEDASAQLTSAPGLTNLSRHTNGQLSSNKEKSNDSSLAKLQTPDICRLPTHNYMDTSNNKDCCPNSSTCNCLHNGSSKDYGVCNDSTTKDCQYNSNAKSKTSEPYGQNPQHSPRRTVLASSPVPLSSYDLTQTMDEGYITCDSVSHKVLIDTSSDTIDSVCNASAISGGDNSANREDSSGDPNSVNGGEIKTATCTPLPQNSGLKYLSGGAPADEKIPNQEMEQCQNFADSGLEKRDMRASQSLKDYFGSLLSDSQPGVSLSTCENDNFAPTDSQRPDPGRDIHVDADSGSAQDLTHGCSSTSSSSRKKPFKQTDL